MDSEPLPDHYKALGVDKNADSAVIKSTYRKLVLKCHPDKVSDPALKEAATDQFHQIQQAYETLVDDEKRADYEAHLKLAALRREKAARQSAARAGDKSARFDSGAHPTGSSRYSTEERKPTSRSYEDDRYFDDRARGKYDTYDAYPKTANTSRSTRPEKETSRSSRPSPPDRTRSDRDKTRAKEVRNDRKFNTVESESSSDEKARYEADYKRRSREEEARKEAAESRRKAEDRRSYEENRYPAAATSQRKMSVQEEEAIRYQHKSRGQVEAEMRPSPVRAPSRDYYNPDSRSSRREVRPEAPRRSSAARPKERTAPSSGRDRDRGIPEIVDWSESADRLSERRPPTFKHASSSPATIEIPARGLPQRSYTTESGREHRRPDDAAPPAFMRSATMPAVHTTSTRQKGATPTRASGLRESVTAEHHSPERDAFPSVPPPQPASSSKKYYYPSTGSGGVSLHPENIPSSASKPRTVLREPGRHHQRSPSPLSRPPIGPNRPSEATTTTFTPKSATRPPPMDRTTSSRNISPVRGTESRGRKLYGEMNSSEARRPARQASYSPSEVQFSRKYGPEDVRWAPRARDDERDYPSKPTLGRTATYVY